MNRSVGDCIASLESAGELRRVGSRVSPILEIAAIADRVSKSPAPNPPSHSAKRNDPRFFDRGGPAILFENVEGSKHPVLINAYGSYRRMEMALGCDADGHTPGGFDAIAHVIGELVKPEPPRSLGEALVKAKQFAPLLKIGPKRSKRLGQSQEVVVKGADIDLRTLPIIRCWPLDGDYASVGYPGGINDGIPGIETGPEWNRAHRGRYITLAGIHTVHADDAGETKPKSHNIGMYRVQLMGRRHMAMHWHVHHDGASHWRSWKKRGERMPVAIALGGEAVLPYAATAPLPPGISELLMAGFLNKRGIAMCPGVTVPLWVPANAEIIIEGWVSHEAGPIGWDPRETDEPLGPGAVFEGPFGDHTGFYSMPDRYPILEVSAITHRAKPTYPTTIVGLPPQEDYYLGKATERLFLPLLKTIVHDIEDYDLPQFGAFHNCACIKISKAYPLQARRVMHSIWGAGQMAWTKTIFVVDESTDVHDLESVLRAASMWCDPSRDIERVRGPLDILDHAAPGLGTGTKIGFDCTRRWKGEEAGEGAVTGEARRLMDGVEAGAYLDRVRAVKGVRDAAFALGVTGWLLVSATDKDDGVGMLERVLDVGGDRAPPFVIVVGPEVDVQDGDLTLFHWVANSDAGRDAVERDGRIGFDATPKARGYTRNGEPARAWPPIIRMDEKTLELVDRRWDEYGIG